MQQLTPKRLLQEAKYLHLTDVLVYDTSATLVFDGAKVDTLEFTIKDPSKLMMFCAWKKLPAQRVTTAIVPGQYKIHSTGEVRGPSNVSAEALRAYVAEHNCRTFGGSGLYSVQYITVD
jgi:hypothetical protein